MANYVTIPASPNQNVNTDLNMLMPYLQGELSRIRDKDKIKLDTLATLQQEARTNPDEFRGTDFQIGADGMIEMNDKAAQMGRVDRDEDRSVAAINDTKKTIDRELTANIGKDAIAELQNTPAYQSAVQASQELGQIDVTKLVTKAMNNQNADGDSMFKNVPDLNSSTPATDAIGNQITNDKGIARTTETDQREEGAVAIPSNYVSADSVNPAPTADPLLRYSGSEPKGIATPVQDNVLRTGTNAEKTVAMAKAFPGQGAKNKTDETKAESAGSKTSKAANYTIKMDRGVGSSTMDVDPVYHTITKTQQGIADTDNSNLKQLRRASALERIVSTSMGGTPQAPKLNTIAGRLAEREAFVNKAELARNSTVTSDTYEGGKAKAVLGEVKAASEVKSGIDSMTSIDVNNKISSGNLSAITDHGAGDSKDGTKYVFDGSKFTSGGEMMLQGGKVIHTGSGKIYPAINADYKQTLLSENKDRIAKAKLVDGYKYVTDVTTGQQFRVNSKGEPENWILGNGQGFNETDAPRVAALGAGKYSQSHTQTETKLITSPPRGQEKDYKQVKDENGKLLGYERIG